MWVPPSAPVFSSPGSRVPVLGFGARWFDLWRGCLILGREVLDLFTDFVSSFHRLCQGRVLGVFLRTRAKTSRS
jgi:hypothetical protein